MKSLLSVLIINENIKNWIHKERWVLYKMYSFQKYRTLSLLLIPNVWHYIFAEETWGVVWYPESCNKLQFKKRVLVTLFRNWPNSLYAFKKDHGLRHIASLICFLKLLYTRGIMHTYFYDKQHFTSKYRALFFQPLFSCKMVHFKIYHHFLYQSRVNIPCTWFL